MLTHLRGERRRAVKICHREAVNIEKESKQ
jgi:hypothetical protein